MQKLVFRRVTLLCQILVLAGCSSGIRDVPVIQDVATLATSTVTFQVKASADDAEEVGGQATSLNSTELEMGVFNNNPRQVGVRFTGVTIPKGARIDSAIIKMKAAQSTSASASFTIAGEASDNAAAYASAIDNIKKRVRTQMSTSWQPSAWTTGSTYATGDFKTVLQEIIDRSGWQSGNAAAFVITGTGIREAVAFDGTAADAPKLVVTYTHDTTTPPPPPPPTGTTFTKAIAQTADDAEEPNGRAAATVSTILELGPGTGLARTIGMRFSGLAIPVGARIDSAVIEMVAAGSDSGATNLTIVGEAADNAAAYADVAGSISGRPKTGASVAWAPPAWTAGTTYAYRTDDLRGVLQEIVSRPGWQSDNAAAFMFTGTGFRRAAAFDSGAAKAPRLVVSYTPAAAPPPPPAPKPLDPAVEAALNTIEADARFAALGTAFNRQSAAGEVTNEGVVLRVDEVGHQRLFVAIVEGSDITFLVRYEAAPTASQFFNVLNGKSASLGAMSSYGNSNGFYSDATLRDFARAILPMVQDDYVDPAHLSLTQQLGATATVQPRIEWSRLNLDICAVCSKDWDAWVDNTLIFNGAFFAMFFGFGQGGGSGYGGGLGAGLGFIGAHGAVKRSAQDYINCYRTQCPPILTGPVPKSVFEVRKVGESFERTVTFGNAPEAGSALSYSYDGVHVWPKNAGPFEGFLSPGKDQSFSWQYDCTKIETVSESIALETNDPSRLTVIIPIELECIDSTARTWQAGTTGLYSTVTEGTGCIKTAVHHAWWSASSSTKHVEHFYSGPLDTCGTNLTPNYYADREAAYLSWAFGVSGKIFDEFISTRLGEYKGPAAKCRYECSFGSFVDTYAYELP